MRLQCFKLNPHSDTSVTKNADGNYVISSTEAALDLVIDSSLYSPRQKLTIFLSNVGKWHVMKDEWMNRSREAWAFAYYQLMIRKTAVANVYFHDSFDDSVLFINTDVACDLSEMEELDRPVWLHDHFADMYPESNAYLRTNIEAKHKLLTNVNTLDSVTAIENQLDLLTDLVGCLIQDQSLPEWASDFIGKMREQSSVRNATELVTKTADYKAEVKGHVDTYLSEKQ